MDSVTIITVCRNSARTIRATLDSVLAQDYQRLKHIVVDGASTDGTAQIVAEYTDRISWLSEPDHGIYDAMNKGLSLASGDIIGFLNSDDVYATRSAITRLVEKMKESNSDTVFGDLVVVDRKLGDRVVRYYDCSRFHRDRLRYGWMPAHPTFLVKRALFERYGGFRTEFQIAADFELIVRLLHRAEATYAYLPEVLVRMRSGGRSRFGIRNSWLLNREIVRACRMNGLSTNLARVLLKAPTKLLEIVRRPDSTRFVHTK